jgi:hypothetical protein
VKTSVFSSKESFVMKNLSRVVLAVSVLSLPSVAMAAEPNAISAGWAIFEEIVKAILAHIQG